MVSYESYMEALKRIGALLGAAVVGVGATVVAMILASCAMDVMWSGHEPAKRTVDSSSLRQIGQAALIVASESSGLLPVAADVHDYARQLASKGGLNAASIWLHCDAQGVLRDAGAALVWDQAKGQLDPEFARVTPSYAVASGLRADMPPETPLAWTRGLLPSGDWSTGSPYHGDGGHIVFLGGNVQFFRNLAEGGGQLRRFDGKGMTTDIREALPPGTQILNNEAGTSVTPWWFQYADTMEVARNAVSGAWLVWLLVVFGVAFVLSWRAFPRLDPKLARIHYVLLVGVPLGLFVLSFALKA
jgi:hypothetical protein